MSPGLTSRTSVETLVRRENVQAAQQLIELKRHLAATPVKYYFRGVHVSVDRSLDHGSDHATSGRMLEYNPTSGLKPASCAYAIATGTATEATHTPATASRRKSSPNR
jgi:hypothetical protein